MRIETPRQQGFRLLKMQNLLKRGGQFYNLPAMRIVPGAEETIACVAANPGNEQVQEVILGLVSGPHAVNPLDIIQMYFYRVDRDGRPTNGGSIPLGEYAAGDMFITSIEPGYALVAEYPITWANNAFTPRWELYNAPIAGANTVDISVPPVTPATPILLGTPPTGAAGAAAGGGAAPTTPPPVIRPVF